MRTISCDPKRVRACVGAFPGARHMARLGRRRFGARGVRRLRPTGQRLGWAVSRWWLTGGPRCGRFLWSAKWGGCECGEARSRASEWGPLAGEPEWRGEGIGIGDADRGAWVSGSSSLPAHAWRGAPWPGLVVYVGRGTSSSNVFSEGLSHRHGTVMNVP